MKLEPSERWYDYRTDRASDAKIAAEATKRFADCKQNLYKDEIINSCAHLVENVAESLSPNKNYRAAEVFLILFNVAKSIRALAGK